MRKHHGILGVLLAGALLAGEAGAARLAPRETQLFRCQVHRGGGRDTRPDNALETFLWCWGHGVAPEADARLTKDGVAIALHDGDLRRVGRGLPDALAGRPVRELTWAEIRDVDTGSYLGEQYATTRIATLESIFAAMEGRPDRLLYLDEKGAPPEQVAELARRHGVERQIYYTSPNYRLMARWRRVVPDGLGMVWLGTWPKDNSPEAVARADAFLRESLDQMAAAKWEGVSQVQIHIRTDLSKEDPFCPSSDCIRRAIARLHGQGVTVQAFTWTCGADKDVLRRIWALGFDNFATDDPLTLFDLLPELRAGEAIRCAETNHLGHLQGVASDAAALYWSFTKDIVKTDLAGATLARVDNLPGHHGDLCVKDGVLYVAVNLGKFNTEFEADSWVYAYRADDLIFIDRWKVPELRHGAGGMTAKGDRFFVVGGLPPPPAGYEVNFVYEYTRDFRFVRRHTLASGYTHLGIQTAHFDGTGFIFGTASHKVLYAPEALDSCTVAPGECDYGLCAVRGRLYGARHRVWKAPCFVAELVPFEVAR